MSEPSDAGVHFDRFHADYDDALARGLSISGEGKMFFARARIVHLARRLRELGQRPSAVLDFGCGTGDSTPLFLEELGVEQVVGVDVSERSLDVARSRHGSERARFVALREFTASGQFPLAFCNGVFHHVPPAERPDLVKLLSDSLAADGHLAVWDNNPCNPGARYVMWRIPFDRGAIMLSARGASRLLSSGGLETLRVDYLFVFPRLLRWLRFLEPRLVKLPLGAQYLVLSRKPPDGLAGGD
jgi:SAM-dependent methyltransferase